MSEANGNSFCGAGALFADDPALRRFPPCLRYAIAGYVGGRAPQ